MLGTKRGTISVVVYILLGLVGVPVFAGFSGGLGIVIGPTGGYIVGFVFTALIIGALMNLSKKKSETVKIVITVVSMILGDVACFIIGTIWFMIVYQCDFAAALMMCVVPYLIFDGCKILLASILVNRLHKYV